MFHIEHRPRTAIGIPPHLQQSTSESQCIAKLQYGLYISSFDMRL